MKIGVFEEIKISLFKPKQYYKLKNISILRLLGFYIIVALISVVFTVASNFFIALFSKNILGFYRYLGTFFTLKNFTISFSYMVVGLFLSSIVISLLLIAINRFKKINGIKFRDIVNYATHSLLICAIFSRFVGAFVILFALGFCLIAVGAKNTILKEKAYIK